MKTPRYTEFRRTIAGWLGLAPNGDWVKVPTDEVIDYLLIRNHHNEIALAASGELQQCHHCEGWLRHRHKRESVRIGDRSWLHVTCVNEWLTTGCNPENYEERELQRLMQRVAGWCLTAPITDDVVKAKALFKSVFGDRFTTVLRDCYRF